MKIKYVTILLFLFLIGCAPRVTILLDGQPVPDYSYVMSNPATGIMMEVTSAKIIKADEEGEEVLIPEYSKVDKIYYVDSKKTKYIMVSIKIKNLKKAEYQLVERCTFKPVVGSGKSGVAGNLIYKGRLRYNTFNIRHDIVPNTFKKISFELYDKRGTQLLEIGRFSYKMVVPEERR